MSPTTNPPTSNRRLLEWVDEWAAIFQPDAIEWCDGSEEEYGRMCQLLVEGGTFEALSPDLRPNSFLARSDPADVARVEDRTFICSEREIDAGPTNNWRPPAEMKAEILEFFTGAMRGRTLYVVPFSMGPLGSRIAHIGVQLTDSPYVVANMRTMTRMGTPVLKVLGAGSFVKCLHSVGYPLVDRDDVAWPCDGDNKYISHFPESREIWSYGSGYGGNALLGKKCFALRIASAMAHDEGWLAEHMLILGVTPPERRDQVHRRRLPVGLWQDQHGHDDPHPPRVEGRVRRGRHRLDEVRRRRPALRRQPGGGLLRRGPGDLGGDEPERHEDPGREHHLHQRGQDRRRRRLVGGHEPRSRPPRRLEGRGLDARVRRSRRPPQRPLHRPGVAVPGHLPELGRPRPACPSRPSSSAAAGPAPSPWSPRRKDWEHGVFLGSIMSSEKTAAAAGTLGEVRFDPFAMLPFCGYNVGEYFSHWLSIGEHATHAPKLPRLYWVNWFQKDEDGKFMWPGFGDNSRVVKWIIDRLEGNVDAVDTPIGRVPHPEDLDVSGLGLDPATVERLVTFDVDAWRREVDLIEDHYAFVGERLPAELRDELRDLEKNLDAG